MLELSHWIDGRPVAGDGDVIPVVNPADGETVMLRKPTYEIEGLNYGPMDARVMVSPRVTPPMSGPLTVARAKVAPM